MGKGIASEPPKRLEGNKFFKCHGYGYFQVDCPSWRTLTIREMEEIQAIEEAISQNDFEGEDHTLITMDMGKLLVIQRALHVHETPYGPFQKK